MAARLWRPIAVLLCVSLGLNSCTTRSGPAPIAAAPSAAAAPDFPPHLQWLNIARPLSLHDLRGKVVLLDFWTFCCINCMHVIPDLKRLEAKYGDALVVIGVHSAKFATEKSTDNIRAAILRYGVTHPVINDKDFEVWNSYGVNAWPTFVLIDPDGQIVASHAGEGPYDAFDSPIAALIQRFDAQHKINRAPLPLKLEKDHAPATVLLFPGKITAGDGKLFIADSNHNRIVIANPSDGSIIDTIGEGSASLADGSFNQARFFHPQGVALDGSALYVADTENHAIRKVDLTARTVQTLASRATNDGFSSPWDVLVVGRTLYIAMAGRHQIWSLDLQTGITAPFAGSGQEDIADGPLAEAAMAQPSGLATDGTILYSADSETSSIRAIDPAAAKVRTVVGKGLFDFGDRDGPPAIARLQHPLGVTCHDGLLYVADTYNNKIKIVDPNTGQTRALAGGLNQPGGLAFLGEKLYIADTNNHAIRVYDPATAALTTLSLYEPRPAPFPGPSITLPAQQVQSGDDTLDLTVTIPGGYAFNETAPFYLSVNGVARNIVNPVFPIKTSIHLTEADQHMAVDLIVYYCQSRTQSLCLVKRLRYILPLTITPHATTNVIHLTAAVGGS